MKKKLVKVAFFLNGFLFLMGGIVLLGEGKLIFGIIQLLASILNILMIVGIRNKKTIDKLNYAMLAMNVIVCTSIAIDYMLSNKTYIQFAWLLAAILSLVTLTLQIKKKKTLPDHVA